MARRSSRTGGYSPSISTPVDRGLPSLGSLIGLDQARALIRAIEDRRRFHPLQSLRPAGALSRSSRRVTVTETPDGKFPRGFSFAVPDRVAVCVRRKTRREVIFARGKAGKGAKARRRRRNRFSNMGC